MITAIRTYRIPLFFAILAIAGLAWWSYGERQNIDEIRREGQRQVAAGLFDIAQSTISAVSRNDDFQHTHMMVVLEKLIGSSPLEFIFLERDGRRIFQTQDAPATLRLYSAEGERFEGGRFLFWRKVRALEDDAWAAALKQDMRPGEKPNPMIEKGDWVLIMGGEFLGDKRQYAAALGRMYFTQVVAFFSVAAGFVVWMMMIRSRLLSEQLAVERLRLAHMEDLGLSAAGLAHETKNPLGIISGIAQQIAQDPAILEKGRMKLEQIIDEVDKATARLGHFMAFARQRAVNATALEAPEVIGKVTAVLQAEFDAAGVELVSDCPLFRVLADEDMLRQILVNLLLNSLHASSEGGKVMVRMGCRRRQTELIVYDRGTGISPELMPKIYKPYVTGNPEGHGLGLAIVKRYVDEHGWTIKIESEVNQGTTVTISGIVVAKDQGYEG
jgi:two-component system sensor histidine kinase HydH